MTAMAPLRRQSGNVPPEVEEPSEGMMHRATGLGPRPPRAPRTTILTPRAGDDRAVAVRRGGRGQADRERALPPVMGLLVDSLRRHGELKVLPQRALRKAAGDSNKRPGPADGSQGVNNASTWRRALRNARMRMAVSQATHVERLPQSRTWRATAQTRNRG